MFQVTDNYWTGDVKLEEVCSPEVRPGGVLVRTAYSLISAGTERMKVQQAQMTLIGKARARPDQVTRVLRSVGNEGLSTTYRKVMSRLKTPVPLGYSLAGEVIAVGDGVNELHVGDRVACGGATANHAEFNFVPQNLCARVPGSVSLDAAACTTVGSIALQSVRQAAPQLGEVVVVLGLGMVGQFCVQLLVASGCKILGIDIDPARLDLALRAGAHRASSPDSDQSLRKLAEIGCAQGADIVLVTASTANSEPIKLATELARDRARIVVVGKTSLQLPWEMFYEKELDLRMSRSYGPGRYDPSYEERGIDYPIGYVRWTEKRNMELFLELLAQGVVQPRNVVSHRYTFENAEKAYSALVEDKSVLGILLEYASTESKPNPKIQVRTQSLCPQRFVRLGAIGAGNHTKSMLLPHLRRERNVEMSGVCTANGWSATDSARRFGFQFATTNPEQVISDPNINAVLIATRHDLHAKLAMTALTAGKAVFLEKPMVIREHELGELERVCATGNAALMVGYNRRFAPHAIELARWMHAEKGPWIVTYRVNAGSLPPNHWYYDPETGGGRLIGEVCHFVDFLVFLFACHPCAVRAETTYPSESLYKAEENAVYTLEFPNGSIGQIIYSAGGDSSIPKEKLEVIGCGGVATLENFRRLQITQGGRRRVWRSLSSDKGHRNEIKQFIAAIQQGASMPIPFSDLHAVALTCFQLQRALRDGQRCQI